MDDTPSERRPFQFSLRKLLFWLAVLGIYLGIVREVEVAPAGAVGWAACLAVFIAIRLKWGYASGRIIASLIMGLAAVCFVADLVWDEPLVLLRCVPLLLFACLLGLLIGFYVFMVAHLVVQAGDWIEELGRVVDHRSAIVDAPSTRCTSRPADGT